MMLTARNRHATPNDCDPRHASVACLTVTSCLQLLCDSLIIQAWRLIMKTFLYAATLAVLVATPVLGEPAVSLVGTWTGERDRIAKVEGRRGGLATLTITEQQGNTFTGKLKRS